MHGRDGVEISTMTAASAAVDLVKLSHLSSDDADATGAVVDDVIISPWSTFCWWNVGRAFAIGKLGNQCIWHYATALGA